MRGLSICAVIAALSHVARADADADAVKQVVTAQADAIAGGDGKAFAATLADDAFVMLAGGYARTPAEAVTIVPKSGWPGRTVRAKVTRAVVGRADAVAWVAAELIFAVKRKDRPVVNVPYRLTELLTRDGTAWKARAVTASMPTTDAPTDWVDQTIDEHPPGGDADAKVPLRAWLGQPADLAPHLRAGGDVVVYGSDTGERGAGPAARSLLGRWKKLSFASAWVRAGGDGKTYAWVASRVMRTARLDDRYVQVPYWLLVLGVRGASDWEVVSVHYSQVPPGEGTM
jgi:hypothetical protein